MAKSHFILNSDTRHTTRPLGVPLKPSVGKNSPPFPMVKAPLFNLNSDTRHTTRLLESPFKALLADSPWCSPRVPWWWTVWPRRTPPRPSYRRAASSAASCTSSMTQTPHRDPPVIQRWRGEYHDQAVLNRLLLITFYFLKIKQFISWSIDICF